MRKHHAKTLETMAEEAAKRNEKPMRPFVLYSLRRTFLTRLEQSGCDAWTLARIAGHASIAISSRKMAPESPEQYADDIHREHRGEGQKRREPFRNRDLAHEEIFVLSIWFCQQSWAYMGHCRPPK